jgi:hypothetical protein
MKQKLSKFTPKKKSNVESALGKKKLAMNKQPSLFCLPANYKKCFISLLPGVKFIKKICPEFTNSKIG